MEENLTQVITDLQGKLERNRKQLEEDKVRLEKFQRYLQRLAAK